MAYVRGRVHLPINPKYAYNSDEIVERAMQTINLFYHFGDNFDVNRICIDIPATWEGLEACRLLEVHGIRTSATMAFNLPQAILAGLNGCTYVSPYIDGTKLHDKTRSPDDDTTYVLCHDIKKYYQERNIKTKVMPGFLTAADTVGKYSGIDNLVISSELLWELSTRTHIVLQKQFNKESQSGTDVGTVENPGPDLDMSVENRAKNLIQFANFDTRSGDASDKDNLVCADKVKQIVSSLCVFQGKLEEMVKHEVAELQAQ
ncbi:hypothetical protein N7468_003584 [Penicillium chermesinum]|uniref:Transaldolase n=1 Tax=Penicillium chermesinum TaxID=63820 RepID=A0A9W9P788_9EURO|nr:uncharacterized protein N7468_003584 [Penicillium chermesinum]KAJ5238965.1 hypothetical protein N7468_003584 [Penicillium chermesinum]KAJ6164608.1 hypothetical protein N7470_003280 [Penicillium chermesinum]